MQILTSAFVCIWGHSSVRGVVNFLILPKKSAFVCICLQFVCIRAGTLRRRANVPVQQNCRRRRRRYGGGGASGGAPGGGGAVGGDL